MKYTYVIPGRFWDKVDIKEPHECWEWTASRHPKSGYGIFYDGKKMYAHRAIMGLPDLDVLHSCDNPPCVNPNHLFTGTHADNMRDMYAKGRGKDYRGEANPSAKLTEIQVKEIRELYSLGHSQRELAKKYGLASKTSIQRILEGKTWSWLN